ncbi:RxLR effector protein [Phytophthora megakarya]|uniref:RxLR effector protein n=1 Tax=Phytophthora megakarya TaxID=4795 RepID=A0A225VVI4_9STRA|nr:RxLR effector protein [Phytophthora megakarya]
MRFSLVLTLAATACILATTISGTIADHLPDNKSFNNKYGSVQSTRYLRSYETTNGRNDEERVVNVLDKVSNLAKSTKSYIDSKRITHWVNARKNGADVLNKLKLGDDATTALSSSKLEALIKYVSMYNEKFSDKQTVLGILTTRFGDDAVAKALVSARTDSHTQNPIFTAYLQQWLKASDAMDAMTSPKLNFFTRYMLHFNDKFPDDKITMIGVLTRRYGDDVVTRTLVNLKSKEDTMVFAKKLWADQQSSWLNSGKTIDDVFKILKLNDDVFWLFTAKKVQALDDYVKLYNRQKGGHEALVTALSKGYGGDSELVKVLEASKSYQSALVGETARFSVANLKTALFEHWWGQNVGPVNLVVKVFKNENGKHLPLEVITQYKEFYKRKMQIFPSEGQSFGP